MSTAWLSLFHVKRRLDDFGTQEPLEVFGRQIRRVVLVAAAAVEKVAVLLSLYRVFWHYLLTISRIESSNRSLAIQKFVKFRAAAIDLRAIFTEVRVPWQVPDNPGIEAVSLRECNEFGVNVYGGLNLQFCMRPCLTPLHAEITPKSCDHHVSYVLTDLVFLAGDARSFGGSEIVGWAGDLRHHAAGSWFLFGKNVTHKLRHLRSSPNLQVLLDIQIPWVPSWVLQPRRRHPCPIVLPAPLWAPSAHFLFQIGRYLFSLHLIKAVAYLAATPIGESGCRFVQCPVFKDGFFWVRRLFESSEGLAWEERDCGGGRGSLVKRIWGFWILEGLVVLFVMSGESWAA